MIVRTLLLISAISLCSSMLYLGFDTTMSSQSQSFFDCAAGRINYNQNGFAIVPYIPTADFAGQVIQAKKAGFLEVHLMIDPDFIPALDYPNIANSIYSSLRYSGTGISAVWLKVSQYGITWVNSETQNVQTISNLLSALNNILQPNFGDVKLGVYTTAADWKQVTGGDKTISKNGYLYWSQLGDTMNCESPTYGFSNCYLQQIQTNNFGCSSSMNIDVKTIIQ